jgi:hypothetical protein
MEYFVEGGVESHTFNVNRVRTEVFIMDDIVDFDGLVLAVWRGFFFSRRKEEVRYIYSLKHPLDLYSSCVRRYIFPLVIKRVFCGG